jgi:hypothetical protein
MRTTRRWPGLCGAALGLLLAGASGCQTWFGGLTLPSGHYLKHYPQYFPESPDFPLDRELEHLEDASRQPVPVAPRPLVPGGG